MLLRTGAITLITLIVLILTLWGPLNIFDEKDSRANGPLVIDGQHGTVIESVRIAALDSPCVVIRNSHNITVRNSEFGPCGGHGIEIDSSSGVRLLDNYIHPEHPVEGCCDTANGIFARSSSDLLIQGNVVAYGEANVQLLGVREVKVIGNFLLNPLGPFPRGTQIQVWGLDQVRSADILVESNYTLASREPHYKFAENQMDAINFGYTDRVVARDNYIVGGREPSGCGLLADDSANGVQFLRNTVIDTSGCGIGIASGTDHVISDNRVLIHGLPFPGTGNTALYVWQQYAGPCGNISVTNNTAVLIRPDGSLSSWWKGSGCGGTTLSSNIFGDDALETLLSADFMLPPPAIPPLAFERPPPRIAPREIVQPLGSR